MKAFRIRFSVSASAVSGQLRLSFNRSAVIGQPSRDGVRPGAGRDCARACGESSARRCTKIAAPEDGRTPPPLTETVRGLLSPVGQFSIPNFQFSICNPASAAAFLSSRHVF
jgi:hypothetical protein